MASYSDDESLSDSSEVAATHDKKRDGEGEESKGLEGLPLASQGRENTAFQRISPLRPNVDTMQIHAEEEAKRVTGSNGEKENASVSKRRPFVLLAVFVSILVLAMLFLSMKSRKPAVSDEMKLSKKHVTVPSLPDSVHDSVKAPNKPLHHYDPLFQLL
tara:strand:+ start:9307 stop:9783 length:477 start_codon:yes stop_codon:yes gene_type:complete